MTDSLTTGSQAADSSKGTAKKQGSIASLMAAVENSQLKVSIPEFAVGDTVKVHCKIREGGKERVQIFEGVVIRRNKGDQATATFSVRKISYNVGVERTFFVHSPMIEKIEIAAVGSVRRAKLYYLRELRGKSARIKSRIVTGGEDTQAEETVAPDAAPTQEQSA